MFRYLVPPKDLHDLAMLARLSLVDLPFASSIKCCSPPARLKAKNRKLQQLDYSNVRNICLLAASILTADAALLIDDDEVFELPDFVPRSLDFLGRRVYGDRV